MYTCGGHNSFVYIDGCTKTAKNPQFKDECVCECVCLTWILKLDNAPAQLSLLPLVRSDWTYHKVTLRGAEFFSAWQILIVSSLTFSLNRHSHTHIQTLTRNVQSVARNLTTLTWSRSYKTFFLRFFSLVLS